MEMRFWDWLCSIFGCGRETANIIAALALTEAALTKRVDELTTLHSDLVRQVGVQQSATQKQLGDLRAMVMQLGEQAKAKPAVAGNMADIRRFMGDNE